MRIATLIEKDSITDIKNEVMDGDRIKLLPSSEWRKYRWNDFRAFCHVEARYGIHTFEQNLLLSEIVNGRKAIEIGAGSGDLGHYLNIPMTDSKQQERPEIKAAYEAMHQPIIKYPAEIDKMDALDAVVNYKPEVVIASWVTTYAPHEMPYGSNPFGIREDIILKMVDTFILIGNIDIHGDKPIMKYKHDEIYEEWIVSRAAKQQNNRIWVWNNK